MAQLPLASQHGAPQRSLLTAVGFIEVVAAMLVILTLLANTLGDDARQTCVWAGRQYSEGARFDNTWPTYCSDYAIALLCAAQALWHHRQQKPSITLQLRHRVVLLLVLYSACMALAGALHHRHDGSQADLNSLLFRSGWTIVVLLTAMSGVALGLIACELLRLHAAMTSGSAAVIGEVDERLAKDTSIAGFTSKEQHNVPSMICQAPTSRRWSQRGMRRRSSQIRAVAPHRIPRDDPPHQIECRTLQHPAVHQLLPPRSTAVRSFGATALLAAAQDRAWLIWAVLLAALVAAGRFSCQRPACDVFIAGSTQSPASLLLQLALLKASGAGRGWREVVVCISLVASAPLAYAYPWLVLHSGFSLGLVNALLHVVIGVSWGLQGALLLSTCERQLRKEPAQFLSK
mmetsp:Transcript_20100/g.46846  ORF Transcript_20100/g.46846 Transcript_20100/m.46846 type:complete len:403 (+) Transcript_20100:104-1312(+)